MYRAALRPASGPAIRGSLGSSVARTAHRRFASNATPADKPRSWKSTAARWGLAAAGVYYYSVNSTFADDLSSQTLAQSIYPEPEPHTVESLVEQRRLQSASRKTVEKSTPKAEEKTPTTTASKATSPTTAAPQVKNGEETDTPIQATQAAATTAATSPATLEEEAGQDGAFNPETGEINWDCPCLGGMAHGPCGEDFKTAFSCFVYSTEEPKGMDCIEKFQGMQECFKKYPEVYGSELEDDSETSADEGAPAVSGESDAAAAVPAAAASTSTTTGVAAPEPVQSFEPVAEPASSGEPPLAEFQTLREDHPVPSKRADREKVVVAAHKGEGKAPWTDNTKANEGARAEK